ncbi:MAG: hypothetical protein JWL96_3717 [Sphingomonas bacterium]|uniref:DUF3052 family protein n=1 Tax=Sphingomonas bacterium TaxID=1895847 RepID=UPI0026261FB9|nr:DUF3052 family protein [Sphingomonas bacterium]MDB5711647.1 hypothetical protein [Sphingomonas bacterium]
MPTGYSGTPLAKKLGLKPGQRAWFADMPDSVRAEIDPEAIGLILLGKPEAGMDAAHVFVTARADLARHVAVARERLAPDGMLWVSWPKKVSRVPTDITEDTIRAVALPTGLVDVKVCAVDEIWSGLKLVIRKTLRTS